MIYTTCLKGGYRRPARCWYHPLASATRRENRASAAGLTSPEHIRMLPFSCPRSYPSGRLIASPGVGPSGLAWLPCPFPLRTISLLSISRRPVGYQSVGMRPIGRTVADLARLDASSETSKTAIALLSASATYSFVASWESARAFGVLPSDGAPGAWSSRYRKTFLARVSTIAI